MSRFIVNRNAQANGDHEVHNATQGCNYMPEPHNQIDLGSYSNCQGAVNKLGEASIAMNGKLLGKTGTPGNYSEVLKNWQGPKSFVLIFAKSRNLKMPYMTGDRIAPAAAKLYEAWGGEQRAMACVQAYSQGVP